MKFKSIFLAAAGFLVLAGAVNPHISPQDVARGTAAAPSVNIAIIEPNVIDTQDPSQCTRNCHYPWTKCVKQCGGGSHCEHKCNCDLFSKPKQLCRVRKCVQPPTECPATKRDIQAGPPVNPCVTCKAAVDACMRDCGGVECCQLSCNCSLKGSNPLCAECGSVHCGIDGHDGTDVDSNDGAVQCRSMMSQLDNDTDPSTAFLPPPCFNSPCHRCLRSIYDCRDQCTMAKSCADSCNCYQKLHNPDCKGCEPLKCTCGHTCSRLNPKQRRLVVGEVSNDVEDLDTWPVDDDNAAIGHELLPPPSPCVWCQVSIQECEKTCSNPGQCGDYCRCSISLHDKRCIGCKIPCNCGHTCPRPNPKQRRLVVGEVTKDVGDFGTEPLDDNIAVVGVPNPCVVCRTGISSCKKKCNSDHACEDRCDCYYKLHTPNCKDCSIPCNCGNDCPRLALRDGIAQPIDSTEDASSTDEGSEVQFGIGVPVSPGSTCLKALNKCKAACGTPGACDDTCNCYYKGARDCKDVKLPECKCGHTCPTPPWHGW